MTASESAATTLRERITGALRKSPCVPMFDEHAVDLVVNEVAGWLREQAETFEANAFASETIHALAEEVVDV